MKKTLSTLCLLLAACGADAAGDFSDVVVPGPGEMVAQGTRVGEPTKGASFEIADGFTGAKEDGALVLTTEGHTGSVFVVVEAATLEEARAALAARQPIDQGVFLEPKGAPEVIGNVIKVRYDVSGTNDPLDAYAVAVVGRHGFGVLFLGMMAESSVAHFEAAIDRMATSVELGAPQTPEPSKGEWANALRGQKLQRFYTSSGYSEREVIWLCPDGSMARMFDIGGVDVAANFSAADRSEYGGTWAAYDENDTLELSYNNGTFGTYNLSTNDEGHLLLDGTRWFREPTNCQ